MPKHALPSSIPGGIHSDLFRMLSPTAKYLLEATCRSLTAKSCMSQYWLPVDYKPTDCSDPMLGAVAAAFSMALHWVEMPDVLRMHCRSLIEMQ